MLSEFLAQLFAKAENGCFCQVIAKCRLHIYYMKLKYIVYCQVLLIYWTFTENVSVSYIEVDDIEGVIC